MTISAEQYTAWLAQDGVARTILIEVGCNYNGSEITRYLSNYGYVTGSTESPANTHYVARLQGTITFSRRVAITSTESPVQLTMSSIELDNLDGELDTWLDDAWEKRSLKAFIGDPSWDRADFRQIFAGRASSLVPSGKEKLTLNIYDEMQRLNFPVTETVLGGTSINKAAILPLTFGEVFNASPLLIDPALHTYKIHNGTIESILEVRDNGALLDNIGNTAYTVNLTAGTFTLLHSPAGQIQCDAQGYKTSGGVYVNTISNIIKEIVTVYGSADTRLLSSEIDTSNFSTFEAANPQALGIYLFDKTNVIDACNMLAKSLQASLYFSRLGKLRLWRPPTTTGVSVKTFNTNSMEANSFRVVEVLPASPAVTLGWGKNWTAQMSSLAGGLPESSSTELSTEWREYSVSDSAAITLHRYTNIPNQEDTALIDETEAQVEAAKRLLFRKVPHKIIEFNTTASAMELELGDEVTIIHPRNGCANGKNGWIIGIEEVHGSSNTPFSVKLEVVI